LEFTDESIRSSCAYQKSRSEVTYSYSIVKPGVYSATMTEHGLRPDLVGSQREYEYSVLGNQLFITTYPQTTKPAPPTQAVRVESKSSRVSCQ